QTQLDHEGRNQVKQYLIQGKLAEADRLLSSQSPALSSLFLGQSYEEFTQALPDDLPSEQFVQLSHVNQELSRYLPTQWDLSLTGQWPYYTDEVFTLYAPSSGQPILKGGRFALTYHGHTWHGVGFTLSIHSLYHYIESTPKVG
ncbi:MAG: ATP phosphoribosyltransferase regulatory subunit, partial [Sulfobacillus thermotolerans]|nr:ATP phosphoribosyltransferase regulatory subunit [Sulfobacillus thermotolerans]